MAERPHFHEHRERLRARFLKAGAEGFHDYELLELLLTFAIPRRDVKPLAKALMERFGSFRAVLDASHDELAAVKGAGPVSALLVRLVKECAVRALGETMKAGDALSSPAAVADFACAALAGLPHEVFMVILLNVKNEVLGHTVIHEGTVDRAAVYPRRVAEEALMRHAPAVILVHNHPSGHPEPSAEDRAITRAIADACRTVDVRILDHVVIGRAGHFSFAEENLL